MDENTQEAFGTLVEDFFSVKVPAETHFAEHMLAERFVSNLEKDGSYPKMIHNSSPCVSLAVIQVL